MNVDSKAMVRLRVIGGLVVALAALAVAGCGSSEEEIPREDADQLLSEVDELRGQVNAGQCEEADATLDTLFASAGNVPGEATQDGLEDLLNQLEQLAGEACAEAAAETTTTTSSSTTEPTTTTTTTTSSTSEPTTSTTTDEPDEDEPDEGPGQGQGQGPPTPPPGGGTGGTGGTPPEDEGGDE